MRSTILPSSLVIAAIVSMALFGASDDANAADVSAPEPKSDAAAERMPIEVSIAIPLHDAYKERVLMYAGTRPHFHVLVSNTSDRHRNIWREWCSWGYYALSFEVTDADGKTRVITKKMPHFWTVNYPDYWTIPPHESLVLDVDFADGDTWQPFPRANKDGPKSFTMRAVFEIYVSDEAKKYSVWTGRVVSKAAKYTAYGPP